MCKSKPQAAKASSRARRGARNLHASRASQMGRDASASSRMWRSGCSCFMVSMHSVCRRSARATSTSRSSSSSGTICPHGARAGVRSVFTPEDPRVVVPARAPLEIPTQKETSRTCSYRDMSLFDGSWSDWQAVRTASLPVQNPCPSVRESLETVPESCGRLVNARLRTDRSSHAHAQRGVV
jgi:hypothetical protein